MTDSFTAELLDATLEAAAAQQDGSVLLVGRTAAALRVLAALSRAGLERRVIGPVDEIHATTADVRIVVICEDAGKEVLLRRVSDAYDAKADLPMVVIAGSAHLEWADDKFDELNAPSLVPSYATGYEFTRVHMYQCLRAAASAGVDGAIVEFGAFKGGTTRWLAKVARSFSLTGPVIAFDSWAGFPPRRSVLDLYEHPRCVFTEIDLVRGHLDPLGVEVVEGDITSTARRRLSDVPVLLAFVDTDNYSPARAAIEAVLPNLVCGGSIVLDHFHTTADYVRTVGERMAAAELLAGAPGLLHLHGTGVFTRLS